MLSSELFLFRNFQVSTPIPTNVRLNSCFICPHSAILRLQGIFPLRCYKPIRKFAKCPSFVFPRARSTPSFWTANCFLVIHLRLRHTLKEIPGHTALVDHHPIISLNFSGFSLSRRPPSTSNYHPCILYQYVPSKKFIIINIIEYLSCSIRSAYICSGGRISICPTEQTLFQLYSIPPLLFIMTVFQVDNSNKPFFLATVAIFRLKQSLPAPFVCVLLMLSLYPIRNPNFHYYNLNVIKSEINFF